MANAVGPRFADDGSRPARAPLPTLCQVFTPLVLKCKELGRAMRIGTNHGSLSARILSFYGDTPAGMVQSAFEFADICRKVGAGSCFFGGLLAQG
jgi:4-hydroxy-3-methylbut-2-en-1-yl diphosphate synthase IspG/GcpE